ncbi:MAG TPA: hypothetical protein VFJ02_19775 [Vicinamibacterales bacterium]|nr:hypothetical protein [Vicinamibacterales bacterium]
MNAPARGQTLGVVLVFIAMTSVMTWPQVLVLATHARDHHDVYFNLWRLAWVAHALVEAPEHLYDGNIFYPEPRTLTYSDAMIVEGLAGAPLFAAGLPPVLIHNLLLLGAIVASGVGMFVLARYLTGSAGAGVVSGVIFAFVPYRFEHYMHMEMQWTVWMPWAFWAFHRTLETRRWMFALLTGLFVSLQMLSSIYYGVFLVVLLGVVATLILIALPLRQLPAVVVKLSPAALVVAVLCGAYAVPYLETKKAVGGRDEREIMIYSARPSSYLVATPDNVIYGRAFASRGRPERRLFPGTLAVVLAIAGLFMRPKARYATTIAYLLAMVLAYEMSLGLSGYSFRFLFDRVPLFQGFRAVARLGIFVVFFLAVLAAFGYAALAPARRLPRRALLCLTVAVLLLEYRVRPLALVRYTNEPPPLYEWLSRQPRGVVAELPAPEEFPGPDARRAYLSTFHWQPIVNGYSGFAPQSHLDRLRQLRNFPDEQAMARLRRDGVRYVVVHLGEYNRDHAVLVQQALAHYQLRELGRFFDGAGTAAVYSLR